MKIELVKEETYNNPFPWYRITIDDVFIIGSYDKEKIEETLIETWPGVWVTVEEAEKMANELQPIFSEIKNTLYVSR